ncbi:dipeptide epimerase [Aerophototrophica crusticola]|uniref:Dipeptide epimerase n=1 Tax=Aerophototrophica crusticola TaxID=1709002 RepID=A0A858R970_9PROT|nr:dipeptide epimerase [Rhodospirillaceae bacterium B3]
MPSLEAKRILRVRVESFPIRGTFRISRGAKTQAAVVVAEIDDDGVVGRGECVPYARYGETVEQVAADIQALAAEVSAGLDRAGLQSIMKAGAARNALDCAFWDLEAKLTGVPVWENAELAAPPGPLSTAFTLSIDTPEAMAVAAAGSADKPLLKLKLAGDGLDLERVAAVRTHAPNSRLVVDANEGWSLDDLKVLPGKLADLGVEMIEQPLPAADDDALLGFRSPLPLGADESAHGLDSLERLRGKYQVVNIKLDKTGGLTEALAMRRAAEAAGLEVMVGCMVATSLAMAPAVYVAQGARYVDLDGPLLLAKDREPGLRFEGTTLYPPGPEVWG